MFGMILQLQNFCWGSTAVLFWGIGRDGFRGGDWGNCPPKTYESNFFHHDFVQFGKQHSQYKTILPSIVSSQQSCEVCFISLTVVNRLDPPLGTGPVVGLGLGGPRHD